MFSRLAVSSRISMRKFHASVVSCGSSKKTIEQLAKSNPGILNGTNVLLRVDFNVPLDKKDSNIITDDTRIKESLPTINFLINSGAKIIIASHCGRPKAKVNEKMRMHPMAKRLSELVGKNVITTSDCIGQEKDDKIKLMKNGDILMLENCRFHAEEEANDKVFSSELAKNVSVYVNDAFGTAHRAHASTEGVAHFVQHKVAGFLLEKELIFLKGAVDQPTRPFAAIVGGAKVSTKIPVLESLIEKCDKIFLGGGMIFTFYRAQGMTVGSSLVEEDMIPMAKDILKKAAQKGVQFILPTDVVVADEFKAESNSKVVQVNAIPDNMMGLDIGPASLAQYTKELSSCRTIVWNGPMGVFEFEKFATGTFGIAHCLAELTSKGATTIIGGGDSVAAVQAAKLGDKMSHISTGGGASLEMLEGKILPGVAALDNA